MAIGGLFLNKTIKFSDKQDDPDKPANPVEKLVAVSRCYRAESSRGQVGVNNFYSNSIEILTVFRYLRFIVLGNGLSKLRQ